VVPLRQGPLQCTRQTPAFERVGGARPFDAPFQIAQQRRKLGAQPRRALVHILPQSRLARAVDGPEG
jgi:hypothetical protein